ncbi:uroplakin-3b [Pristis pectinata]|uniref:uroplakin-3b n=1 Tax=Pristis pectinata TaxID=685728 RepID=UPI00223DFCCC|nr:uroplakin-3b [Pristis pectinata]
MKSLTHLVLLFALCGLGYGVPRELTYIPEVLQATTSGRITQTTAELEQPFCVFDDVEATCTFCEVWLVVDNITTNSAFDVNNNHVNPSDFMSQNFQTNGFYLTVKTARNKYQCLSTMSTNIIVYTLRVGNEVPCTTDNCNAPLPTGATFRVRYILLNPFVSTNNVFAVTQWSRNIKLLDATDPNTIDTSAPRTGGMVVITTILVILLFLLLALFIAMLAMVCCRKSGTTNFHEPVNTFGSLRRYNTHSLQNKGNIITSKGNI